MLKNQWIPRAIFWSILMLLACPFCLAVDEEPEDVLTTEAETGARIWQVPDPLFEELITDQPVALPGEVGMLWTHPFSEKKIPPIAVQYGLEYSLEETGEHFKELNLHPVQEVVNIGKILAEKPYPQAPSLVKLNWYRARGEGMPAINASGQTLLLAPKNRQAYLDQTREFLKQYGDKIWGIYSGDEVILKQRKALFAIYKGQEAQHPYLQEIEDEVRQRYGLGKYGLPRSNEDEEPYKWIAMNRWLDDEWCATLAGLRQIVDEVAPGVILVSDDPVSGFKGYDFSLRGKYCDVLTHQICPSRNPLRQEFAFFTKLLVDMSGKTVFPCAHIENYVISMSPEETVETLSQIFRVGGRGLHYYPSDVKGVRRRSEDTGFCRLGAPARWAAAAAVLRTAGDMPAVAVPKETGTMVLMERSSYDALPVPQTSNHAEYAMCSDLLGPHAGSWFQFVHGGQLERGEVELAKYKVIYLPMAKFFQSANAERLIEYVKQGGTVVCGDPEVFTYAADKDYLPPEAASALGWKAAGEAAPQTKLAIKDEIFSSCLAKDSEIDVPSGILAFPIKAGAEWIPLATFADGSPAIAKKEIGEGEWIQFAFQPFVPKLIEVEPIRDMFKALQKSMGEPTDLDIWRFQFPMPENLPAPPAGQCLTGNAVFWRQNEPIPVGGTGVEGTMSWSIAPAGTDQKELPFNESKLSDRRRAVQAANTRGYGSAVQKWAYQWDGGDAFELEVKFAKKQDVSRIALWYSGTLPEVEIKPMWDKQECGLRIQAASAGEDVLKAEVPCEWGQVDGIVLKFPARTEPMVLCELEAWNK